MNERKIALIPSYEPDDTLISLLKEVKDSGFDIVVVNDGSGKEKDMIFEEASIYGSVLTHETNKGKGAALKTGLSFIEANYPSDSIVVTMDSDGQHKVSDANKIADAASKHPDALILGSRKFKGNVPVRSLFGNKITKLVYQISTGVKVEDTQTGLRAFSISLIPFMLTIDGERYEYEMNVLLMCCRNKVEIIEEEIETVYINDNSSSHFNTLKDSFRIYKEILKFSCASLLSFVLDYGLFSLLTILTSSLSASMSLGISNVVSRLISASFNFTINRKYVFKSNSDLIRSIIQYAILAGFILASNTAVLTILVNSFGINRFIAKIITEILFFFVSWFIQHQYIFDAKPRVENGGMIHVSKAS